MRALVVGLVALLWLASHEDLLAANHVVRMQGMRFMPRDIPISIGDSITWTNLDFSGHDSVSGTNGTPSGFWRTPLFGFGSSATVVFTNIPPGSYGYYCTPHFNSGMVGSVTVLPPNVPPTVEIIDPGDGAVVPAATPLTILADALDADGRVVRVDFSVDGTFLSSDSLGPFSATYANPTPGSHVLRVVAVDDRGATSAPVTVTITALLPPSILQQPQSANATELGSASFSVIATGAPPLVYQWQFDGADIPGATSPTYSIASVGTNDAGNYTVLVSNAVGSVLSSPATLSLQLLPVVDQIITPLPGARFPDGSDVLVIAEVSDGDTNGFVARVEFQLDGTPVAVATNAPWRGTITNLAAGPHTITVTAIDNDEARSIPKSVAIRAFAPPGVVITQPSDGSVRTQLTALTLVATVSPDAPVTNVQFFGNATKLGEVALLPPANSAQISWQPSAFGNYEFRAIATDDLGQRGTSAPVAVLIYDPVDKVRPTISLASSQPNFAKLQSTNVVWLSGTAADDRGLNRVELSQADQFGGGAVWLSLSNFPPGTLTGNWRAGVVLPPGQSTVQVRSVDLAMNYSLIQTRYFTFVARTGQLVLAASPEYGGTVTPGSRTNLEIGARYRLAAKSVTGFLFAGWTNNVSGAVLSHPSFDLVMSSYENWTALFATNRWLKYAGGYTGLVTNKLADAPGGYGLLTLKVTSTGQFTSKLKVDGKSYSAKGAFDAAGFAHAAVIRPGQAPIALHLAPGGSDDSIHVDVLSDVWEAAAECDRNPYADGSEECPYAGNRVFVWEQIPAPRLVAGTAMSISVRGAVKLKTTFADGRQASASSTVSSGGLIAVAFSSAQFDSLLGWANVEGNGNPVVSGSGYLIPAGTNGLPAALIIRSSVP